MTAEQVGYDEEKIALGRLIGLPPGQDVVLTDVFPYAPLDSISLDQAMTLAAQNRSDLKAVEAQMHARNCESSCRSAKSIRWISAGLTRQTVVRRTSGGYLCATALSDNCGRVHLRLHGLQIRSILRRQRHRLIEAYAVQGRIREDICQDTSCPGANRSSSRRSSLHRIHLLGRQSLLLGLKLHVTASHVNPRGGPELIDRMPAGKSPERYRLAPSMSSPA